jgi:hypothetical protein
LPGQPAAFGGVQGVQAAPPNPEIISANLYIEAAKLDPKQSAHDILKNASEIAQKRYYEDRDGVLDRATGMYYAFPKGELVEREINGKSYKVSGRTAVLLDMYWANNDPRYWEVANQAIKGPPRPGAASGDGAGGIRSESEKKREEAFTQARTEAEIATFKDFDQRRKEADDSITTANVFRRFAADPNASRMFGILNNDKISSGIATLVRDGIGIPGFTVGTRAIEDIMRNAGLNAADQAKYRTFLTYAAMMQLQAQKYMKGAVSDREQDLLRSSGISAQDTPDSIRMKADLLTRRAQFDRRVAKAFKDSKMSPEEFLDSKIYEEMRDKYNEDLADLASGERRLVPAPRTPAPAGQNPGLDAARERARRALEGN